MKSKLIQLLIALFATGFLMTSSSLVTAADNPKVKEAMKMLKDTTDKLGKAKLEGDVLMFGTTKINNDFTVVDAVKAKMGGTATLFAKKGGNFVRVSTNVMKDGNRAVGTSLDPSGPAAAAIRQGNAFYGAVDILGKIFDTGYEPIKNAAGEIIGVYYVGYALE